MSDEIDSMSDAKHRPRLSDKQRGLILLRLREGVKSTDAIAEEAGCSSRHVRRVAVKEGVKPPSRVEKLAREALDRDAAIAQRAYNALKQLSDNEWKKLNPNTLSQIIERHDSLLFKQIQSERERMAPSPIYQPDPLKALLLGIFAGQGLAKSTAQTAGAAQPGGWMGASAPETAGDTIGKIVAQSPIKKGEPVDDKG